MTKVAIIYYSATGNDRALAETVAEGLEQGGKSRVRGFRREGDLAPIMRDGR